ncbi:mycofactocin-coupled SDR family oxidoreductase [Nocardioides sp. AN3]
MGRVDGKVALITGAARGQGRSHAVRLAEEGADIIAVDLCRQIDTVEYDLATEDDLAETARLVEALGRRVVTRRVDVRDGDAMRAVVEDGLSELGQIDVVSPGAGILSAAPTWELTERQWDDLISVNLTGVWQTLRAVVPAMIAAGRGGSIVLTGSSSSLIGFANLGHYGAAKHGVLGLMKVLALELAPHFIRVNTVCPGAVETPMVANAGTYKLFTGGKPDATFEDAVGPMTDMNAMPIPWIDPVDVSNAVLYLASDESRYVTGAALPIDAGNIWPHKLPHAVS